MILESLNWRYATKIYDPARVIPAEQLQILKEATRLSVSSLGLQPYRILIVENHDIRKELRAAAYDQNGITDASHLFVFAIENNLGDAHIERYLENISQTRSITSDNLEGFKKMIHNFVGPMTDDQKSQWAKKQAYIALSTFINTAAMLELDATPMEGFDTGKFDSILGLEAMDLQTAVVATVGYRSDSDAAQHLKKVRKPENELFINI